MKRVLSLVLLASLAACAGLLGLNAARRSQTFEHRAHVLQGVSCTSCHAGTAVATSTTPVRLPDAASCLACHEQPHDQRPCMNCHGSNIASARAEMARRHLTFSHDQHVPQTGGQCVRCHVKVSEERELLIPTMPSCLSCHAHEDTFETKNCESCHVDLETEGVRPSSHVVHGADFSTSHGAAAGANADLCATCHSQRECASCHGVTTAELPWRMQVGSPRLSGLHRAGYLSRHSTEARAAPGTCVTCHSTQTCQSCHVSNGIAASADLASPHPPGWVGLNSNRHGREARRDPASCASCHSGAGEMMCVDCHRVGGIGGTVHPPGWSSRKNSRTDLPCRLCHSPI